MESRGLTVGGVWDFTQARLAKEIITERKRTMERMMDKGVDYRTAKATVYPEEGSDNGEAFVRTLKQING